MQPSRNSIKIKHLK